MKETLMLKPKSQRVMEVHIIDASMMDLTASGARRPSMECNTCGGQGACACAHCSCDPAKCTCNPPPYIGKGVKQAQVLRLA